MLKITLAALAVTLAGTAGADESRSLRVDASTRRAFEQSLAVFKEELSLEHREAFGDALKDIWIAGVQAADAEGRDYRRKDYYRQLDGLSYEEVIQLTTGEAAKLRLQAAAAPPRAAAASRRAKPPAYSRSPWEGVPPPPSTWQPRGGTPLFGPGPPP